MVLIPLSEVSRVDLICQIVENAIVAIGDNHVAHLLKCGQIVDDAAALEGLERAGRFVNDNLDSMRFKLLNNIDGRALPKVVRSAFHGQAEGSNDLWLHCQNLVDDKPLACAVGIDDGANQALGNILEVGEQLLGILGQTAATIAKAGVVVMGANARVQANALDDIARVEAFALGIGVELVKVRNPQRQMCVGKELDGLGLIFSANRLRSPVWSKLTCDCCTVFIDMSY